MPATNSVQFDVQIPTRQPEVRLNRYCRIDSAALASSHSLKSTLWKVAAYATIVAFTALAITAAVFVALYAPIYIPVAAIVTTMALPAVYKAFKVLNDKGLLNGIIAEREQKIADKLSETKGNEETKPLEARLLYWTEVHTNLKTKSEQLFQETPKAIEEKIAIRQQLLTLNDEILITKIRTAYFQGLMDDPTRLDDLEDMIEREILPLPVRLLLQGDEDVQKFLSFKDGKEPLTINSVKEKSIKDLVTALFAPAPEQEEVDE